MRKRLCLSEDLSLRTKPESKFKKRRRWSARLYLQGRGNFLNLLRCRWRLKVVALYLTQTTQTELFKSSSQGLLTQGKQAWSNKNQSRRISCWSTISVKQKLGHSTLGLSNLRIYEYKEEAIKKLCIAQDAKIEKVVKFTTNHIQDVIFIVNFEKGKLLPRCYPTNFATSIRKRVTWSSASTASFLVMHRQNVHANPDVLSASQVITVMRPQYNPQGYCKMCKLWGSTRRQLQGCPRHKETSHRKDDSDSKC